MDLMVADLKPAENFGKGPPARFLGDDAIAERPLPPTPAIPKVSSTIHTIP
jgi:hypothetical protein